MNSKNESYHTPHPGGMDTDLEPKGEECDYKNKHGDAQKYDKKHIAEWHSRGE